MKDAPNVFQNENQFQIFLKKYHTNGNQYNLTNCHFEFDVVINNALYLNLENCVFKKRFKIEGTSQYDFLFKNIVFEDIADFSNFTFSKNVRFHGCGFKKTASFDNTKFKGLADFYYSRFIQPTIFFKTDFNARTVFSAVRFEQNVLFTYSLIESHFILRGAKFNKGLDLSLALLSGTINLFGLKIPNYTSVKDINDEDEYDQAVCVKGLITHKNKRETFRILKKALQEQGNAIDALNMAALEKNAYSKQLQSEMWSSKKGLWRILQNQLILFLGRVSNSHGESWSRGVLFTLLIGTFFFYLSIINTQKFYFTLDPEKFDWKNFEICFNYYFEFLLPTHTSDYLKDFQPNSFFTMWDFVGRIFVSFGIYQTVVAFRKYHSK
jgi:hypothetical protein